MYALKEGSLGATKVGDIQSVLFMLLPASPKNSCALAACLLLSVIDLSFPSRNPSQQVAGLHFNVNDTSKPIYVDLNVVCNVKLYIFGQFLCFN